MRLAIITASFVFAAGAAFAQAPQVTIEDDVAPATAIKCAGLRMAQSEVKPDALITASRDAWLRSGVDATKAKEEAARLSAASPDLKNALADECAPFEIRSAPPARS